MATGDFVSAGGGLLGAGLTLFGGLHSARMQREGQEETNETNLAIAREQMAFQERMSSTAIQRRRKDLEAAGINPMFAAMGQGATQPTGQSAVMQNPKANLGYGQKVASAISQLQLSKLATELGILKQTERRSAAEADQAYDILQAGRVEVPEHWGPIVPGQGPFRGMNVAPLLVAERMQQMRTAAQSAASARAHERLQLAGLEAALVEGTKTAGYYRTYGRDLARILSSLGLGVAGAGALRGFGARKVAERNLQNRMLQSNIYRRGDPMDQVRRFRIR